VHTHARRLYEQKSLDTILYANSGEFCQIRDDLTLGDLIARRQRRFLPRLTHKTTLTTKETEEWLSIVLSLVFSSISEFAL